MFIMNGDTCGVRRRVDSFDERAPTRLDGLEGSKIGHFGGGVIT